MITIKTPATSANLGSGFDCLGIALNLFNTFKVEKYACNYLENIDSLYNNDNNLFLQAYRAGCDAIGKYDPVHVIFDCHIPISRGLGSSASLIVAGLVAASVLHYDMLTETEIFRIASAMEGHPDNIAPCIYGSFCACMAIDQKHFIAKQLPIHDDWKYMLLVPDFKLNTEQARKILPQSYPGKIVAKSIGNAVLTTHALIQGDQRLLHQASQDVIHEPYRKTLIPEFDTIQQIVRQDTNGVLLISGSGSACILIAKHELSISAKTKIMDLPHHWQCLHVELCTGGTQIWGEKNEL